jgi:hypothetical protein
MMKVLNNRALVRVYHLFNLFELLAAVLKKTHCIDGAQEA